MIIDFMKTKNGDPIYCWHCDNILGQSNKSLEHILIQACGGKLKSRSLLCSTCNNQFGESFDSVLAKQLSLISILFNIKRERGKVPERFKYLRDPEGIQYRLVSGSKLIPELDKPTFKQEKSGDEVSFTITVRTMEELLNKIVELKKKHPSLDAIEVLRNARESKEYIGKPLEFSIDIGGISTYKSILKTAINFYIYSGGSRDNVSHIIPTFDHTEDKNKFVWFHYPEKILPSSTEHRLCHNLYLRGSKEKGLLYCYVEYYDTYSFLVKLSTEYSGEELIKSYSFDLLGQVEVPTRINSNLSKVELEKIFIEIATPRELKERLDRMVELATEIQKTARREPDLTTLAVKTLLEVVEKQPEHIPIANERLLDVISLIKAQIREKMKM